MNRLRDLRKSRGMTLEELGRLINIQKSTIAKYEKGQVEMSTSILEKLSGVFNVSIDYIVNNPNANFVTPAEPATPLSEKDSELIEMSKNLDSENYKVVINFIKALNKKQQFSEEEINLINDYRVLDNDGKNTVKSVLDFALRNSRQT